MIATAALAAGSNSATSSTRRVGVVDVVVAQLLALQLARGGDAGARGGEGVERRRLVRVLAVAHGLLQRAGDRPCGPATPRRPGRRTRPRSPRRRRRCGRRRGRRAGGAGPASCRRPSAPPAPRPCPPARCRPRRRRGSWPPSGSSPGRRCRCSRRTRRSPRRAPPWPRTGRGSRRAGRSAPMPCSVIAAACSGASRTPSRPPCTTGCRVFTRPSIISGKPVSSATSFTGRPAAAMAARGAAGRDQLDAGGGQRPGGLDEAGLVGDRDQGAADGDEVGRGGISGRSHGVLQSREGAQACGFWQGPRSPVVTHPSPVTRTRGNIEKSAPAG